VPGIPSYRCPAAPRCSRRARLVFFARLGGRALAAADFAWDRIPRSRCATLPKLVGLGVSTPFVLLARAWTGIRAWWCRMCIQAGSSFFLGWLRQVRISRRG
jgi:hypothetical protein